MTKHIRIENADTSDHKVKVEVWNKGQGDAPDTLLRTVELNHPTALAQETIWKDGQFLVVKEA
jgi:hypothetical protein